MATIQNQTTFPTHDSWPTGYQGPSPLTLANGNNSTFNMTPRSWNPANKMTSLFEPGCIGCIFLSKPYVYQVLGPGKPSPWPTYPSAEPSPISFNCPSINLSRAFHCLLLWYLYPISVSRKVYLDSPWHWLIYVLTPIQMHYAVFDVVLQQEAHIYFNLEI